MEGDRDDLVESPEPAASACKVVVQIGTPCLPDPMMRRPCAATGAMRSRSRESGAASRQQLISPYVRFSHLHIVELTGEASLTIVSHSFARTLPTFLFIFFIC